jgi:hypothetical protein
MATNLQIIRHRLCRQIFVHDVSHAPERTLMRTRAFAISLDGSQSEAFPELLQNSHALLVALSPCQLHALITGGHAPTSRNIATSLDS